MVTGTGNNVVVISCQQTFLYESHANFTIDLKSTLTSEDYDHFVVKGFFTLQRSKNSGQL